AAARAAANAAAADGVAAYDAAFDAIEADAYWLEGVSDRDAAAAALLATPLWANQPPPDFVDAFLARLDGEDGHWRVWRNWYRRLEDGQPAWDLVPEEQGRFLLTLAEQKEGFWKAEAKSVNEQIAQWLADAQAGRDLKQLVIRQDQALQHDRQPVRDYLGRRVLAEALARRLIEIWEAGQTPRAGAVPAGFVAHIDAPWGGGKTSFAEFVAEALSDGPFLNSTRNLTPKQRVPWIIVRFNAWQYSHVSPLWRCFYEEIRRQCFDSIRRTRRAPGIAGSSGTIWPKECPGRYTQWARLWLREGFWRMGGWPSLGQFGFLVGLGIVAFYLLGAVFNGQGDTLLKSLGAAATAIAAFLGLSGQFRAALARLSGAAHSAEIEAAGIGALDPTTRLRKHLDQMLTEVERPVLVIVDDLNRVTPDHVAELIRGMQTILTSPRLIFLLLGDRRWIAKAYELYHDKMADLDVDAEIGFGERFVQKAIQLSFVLPGMAHRKEAYVRALLLGPDAADRPEPIETVGDDTQTGDPEPSSPNGPKEKPGGSGGQPENGEPDAPPPPDDPPAEPARRTAVEAVQAQIDEAPEIAGKVRHALEGLAALLPDNPRQIKRILNAIALYQASLTLVEADEEGLETPETQINGEKWRKMVIAVIAQASFPQAWQAITQHPDLLIGLQGVEESAPDPAAESLEQVTRHPALVQLLTAAPFGEGEEDRTALTRDDMRWLLQVVPGDSVWTAEEHATPSA
ncbi:MAG: P-loop NTPase fold protein, partial [Rhodothalassiaceae bacterium]